MSVRPNGTPLTGIGFSRARSRALAVNSGRVTFATLIVGSFRLMVCSRTFRVGAPVIFASTCCPNTVAVSTICTRPSPT